MKNLKLSIFSLGILFLLFLFSIKVQGADIVEVVPITNKILLVHFDDGHVIYSGYHESPYNGGIFPFGPVVYSSPLNLTDAIATSKYSLNSSDDANYNTALNPVNIYRKSKPVDFVNSGYLPSGVAQTVSEHWIYIELPTALVMGKSYTLSVAGLAENFNTFSFVFDVTKIQSPAIHVNQVGFSQNAPKSAYISYWAGTKGGIDYSGYTSKSFKLVRVSDNAVVKTGTISLRLAASSAESKSTNYTTKNYSRTDVYECNFSDYTTAGEYKVVVDDLGSSYPFTIDDDAYRTPFYYAMKGLFYQRSGICKEIRPGISMPRDHYAGSNGVVMYYLADKFNLVDIKESNIPTTGPQVTGIWGWYQDAGDWDGMIYRHSLTTLSMLALYDMYPDKFVDGEIGNRYKLNDTDPNWIDEGTNGIPDILDEAVWLINFQKRAKDRFIALGYSKGGVPGYVGVDACSGWGIPAWEDNRRLCVTAAEVKDTYNYSACAAWYAICLNKFWQLTHPGQNHPDAASWQTEAINAYNWASNDTIDPNRTSLTAIQSKELAASCLYRLTGSAAYQTDFETQYNADTQKGWGTFGSISRVDLASCVYGLCSTSTHPNLNVTLQTNIKNLVVGKSTKQKIDRTGYPNAFRSGVEVDQYFQNGTFTTSKMGVSIVAYRLTNDVSHLNAVQNAASYQLGGNQLNYVYLSGLGENPDNCIFNPNIWTKFNHNSPAYKPEMLEGYNTYFGAKFSWVAGISDENWGRNLAFPLVTDWPESEQKFTNRYSINGAEYTINENQAPNIMTFGFLKAQSGTVRTYTKNQVPEITLNLTDSQQIAKNNSFTLTSNASSDTRSVKYYYDWHFIGESFDKANSFSFIWDVANCNLSIGANPLITAIAIDNDGLESRQTSNGEKTVSIVSIPTYTLIVSATNGSVSINPIKTSYNAGETVTLTAIANTGFRFTGWSGSAISTTNPLTVTMSFNINITANFMIVPKVDVKNNGFEAGNFTGWYADAGVSISTIEKESGTYSAKLGRSNSAGFLSQKVTGLSPNTTYTMIMWAKTDAKMYFHAGVSEYGGATVEQKVLNQTTWALKKFTFTMGATNTSAKIYCWIPPNNYGYVDDFSIEAGIKSGEILNTANLTGDKSILVYPNPVSSGILTINLSEMSLETPIVLYLRNINGAIVKYLNYNSDIEYSREVFLSVEDLNSGLYFLSIQNGMNIYTQKVIVE